MSPTGAVHRWDVFWADLEPGVGHEQKGAHRPVIVVSNDGYNAAFRMVTVVPATKLEHLEHKVRRVYPFEVLLPKGTLSAQHASIAMPHQVRSISSLRLVEKIGVLGDARQQVEIENRLLEHLGIAFEPDEIG